MQTFLIVLVTVYCCMQAAHAYSISRNEIEYRDSEDEPESKLNILAERAVADEELSICNAIEPCLFVVSKRNPKDNSVKKNPIPSWCRCRDGKDACKSSFYDRKKKVETYRCVSTSTDDNVGSAKRRYLRFN